MKKSIILLVIGIVLVIIAGVFCYMVYNTKPAENIAQTKKIDQAEEIDQEKQEALNELEKDLEKHSNNVNEESKTVDLEDVEYTDFSVEDKTGKKVSLADYKDNPVFIMVYSEKDEDSMKDLEKIVDLYEDYKDDVNFMIINVDEEVENEEDYPFEIYFDKENEVRDAYKIENYPALIYITKDNEIINAKTGFTTSDSLEANLDILSEKF